MKEWTHNTQATTAVSTGQGIILKGKHSFVPCLQKCDDWDRRIKWSVNAHG